MNCLSGCILNVINLANSIIGVSILAMPYCFKKCGIMLSIVLILISGLLVRISCYLLLKCAIMARRRNFENLAFYTLGPTGKLAVEIGIIGFLIGVCIAFFVVIGDLGPPLASEYMMLENSSNLRAEVLVFLGLFVALPLGLLKNVNSLTSLSAFSIAFYGWLVLKIFSEAASKLILNEWWHQVSWWNVDGILPCLPIFSMALSCQTQLFEFFDTLSEPSLKRMMSVVNGAVGLCTTVYILVGFFGYVACHDKRITGNILLNLSPSVITECIKLIFVVTIVISFPLCLFPCRTSLHSLLFKQGPGHHDIAVNYIPENRFRFLTISLVIVTIGVAIMIPNIEFALGIIGSTIGTMICLIFPALVFVQDTNKNTTEKRMAQGVMCIGMFILIACTYSTLKEGTESKPTPEIIKNPIILPHPAANPALVVPSSPLPLLKSNELPDKPETSPIKESIIKKQAFENKVENEKRQEPPVPQEQEIKPVVSPEPKIDLDPQALQKEDKEIQKETAQQVASNNNINLDAQLKDKQEQILQRLEEQQNQQKLILEQQQKVLKELIQHKEIHEGELKLKESKLIHEAESPRINDKPKQSFLDDKIILEKQEKVEFPPKPDIKDFNIENKNIHKQENNEILVSNPPPIVEKPKVILQNESFELNKPQDSINVEANKLPNMDLVPPEKKDEVKIVENNKVVDIQNQVVEIKQNSESKSIDPVKIISKQGNLTNEGSLQENDKHEM